MNQKGKKGTFRNIKWMEEKFETAEGKYRWLKKKKKTISLISTNGVANVFYYLSSILIVFNIIRKIKV